MLKLVARKAATGLQKTEYSIVNNYSATSDSILPATP